jgi:hypothetical protein
MDAYGKIRKVSFVPREKIKNLKKLDEDIKATGPPPPIFPN